MLSKHEWRQDSTIFFYSPCLREDFPKLVLPLSLFHMDLQYVKGDEALLLGPIFFDLLLIKSGLRGGVRIIKPIVTHI